MKDDPEYANGRIEKMKNKLGVDYDILLAGSTNELSKARALPMLNSIKSYPTTIFLDKAHKVRKIHTGFSGPGTGLYYDKYVEEFELIIEKLLAE
ncbi:MAG: hypothetical protein HC819_16210 [Cyclobacteriaceae bacterium]|nr:hypothetical protein [Cyclobacteriaceae bacterium]